MTSSLLVDYPTNTKIVQYYRTNTYGTNGVERTIETMLFQPHTMYMMVVCWPVTRSMIRPTNGKRSTNYLVNILLMYVRVHGKSSASYCHYNTTSPFAHQH